MTEPEAFERLDGWCSQAARLMDDTEESVVNDCRNPTHLAQMAAVLKVDPVVMMKWVLKRRGKLP